MEGRPPAGFLRLRVLCLPAAAAACSLLAVLLLLLLLGRFLGGAANGTKPPTARQSRPARQIQK
jgi:hypothetical protein